MLFGQPIAQIYLYTLIICAILSIFVFLFGDMFDFEGPVDPMLIVPWIAFFSLFGYIGEIVTNFDSILIAIFSIGLSTLVVFLLNFYILVPLRNSESSISVSEKTLEGRRATVVTPIPLKGMGEITIGGATGIISRPASFYKEEAEELKAGSEVLIIEIRERVCYVVPYSEQFK